MTRIRGLVLALCAFAVCATAQQPPRPVPVRKAETSRVPLSFRYRWKAVFRGSFPETPLRVRIFRGSKDEILAELGTLRLGDNACVTMRSMVVNPTRTADRLTLPFYFRDGWLTPNGDRLQDGAFVFVFEVADDRWATDAPPVALEGITLRATEATRYLKSGVDVSVIAPAGRRSVTAANRDIHNAVAAVTGERTGPGPVPPPVPPPQTAVIDCDSVVIEPPPLQIVLHDRRESIQVVATRFGQVSIVARK